MTTALVAPTYFRATAVGGGEGVGRIVQPYPYPYVMLYGEWGDFGQAPAHRLVPISRRDYFDTLYRYNAGTWRGWFNLPAP